MMNKNQNKYADRIVNAFLKNKIISPLPRKLTKKISNAQKFRKLCESKINKPISGFKAAGTGIPVLKKLNEKEPFYAITFFLFLSPPVYENPKDPVIKSCSFISILKSVYTLLIPVVKIVADTDASCS